MSGPATNSDNLFGALKPWLESSHSRSINQVDPIHDKPNVKRQIAWVLYGQASRAISTGKLNALLRVHTQPINVVVFDGPLETLKV